MQRQSTIRRQSRIRDDDVVIKGGHSFCDVLVLCSLIVCILSLLAGPPLMGLVAAPLLKVSGHSQTSLPVKLSLCTELSVSTEHVYDVPSVRIRKLLLETSAFSSFK